jgi:hypothetical protein
MLRAVKILAMLVAGIALGLAATWVTAIRGTMGGDIDGGPWRTSLYIGSSESGPYLRAADFLLIGSGAPANDERLPVAAAPTNRGIVLLRTLISDDARIAELDVARRHVRCAPYRTG